jgi:hypothetical protein
MLKQSDESERRRTRAEWIDRRSKIAEKAGNSKFHGSNSAALRRLTRAALLAPIRSPTPIHSSPREPREFCGSWNNYSSDGPKQQHMLGGREVGLNQIFRRFVFVELFKKPTDIFF